MLHQAIKYFLISFLGFSAINSFAADKSTDYLPPALLPITAVSAQDKSSNKKQVEKNMTEAQKQGLKEAEDAVAWMRNPKYIDQSLPLAKAITERSQTIIQNSIDQFRGADSKKQLQGHLYYFISFSMPDSLIKAYMLDAALDGGVLVLRGVDKDMDLHDFIFKKIMPLVQYKGSHAEIEIDPNLFEEYQVELVPTIVFTIASNQVGCNSGISGLCQPIDSNLYWKMSGGVSSFYALEQFRDAGAPDEAFIKKMQHVNNAQTEMEQEFKGDWSNVDFLGSKSAIDDALEKYGLAQTAGGAIGPIDFIKQLSEQKNEL